MMTTDFPGVRWRGHWVAPDGTITVFNLTCWSLHILGLRPLLTTRPWTPIRRSRSSAVHHPTQGNDLREARSKEHPCPT